MSLSSHIIYIQSKKIMAVSSVTLCFNFSQGSPGPRGAQGPMGPAVSVFAPLNFRRDAVKLYVPFQLLV